MSRQSNLQHNLHIRGSGYLDSSFLNERFMVSEYPLKYGHAIPGVLPGLQCQRMTISPYCANSHVHELSWNSTPSAIQSNGLYSAMGNQNSNTPVLNWRVARTKMNGFPHLDAYRDMMCSSHLCSDRSRAHGSRDAFKSQLFQQEQTGCYSYADPLSKAPIQYLQRLSEMATLERNTIRQEDMKKLRTKKED